MRTARAFRFHGIRMQQLAESIPVEAISLDTSSPCTTMWPTYGGAPRWPPRQTRPPRKRARPRLCVAVATPPQRPRTSCDAACDRTQRS
jgi:hypothetical protein